jgi:hypothetical protein
MTALETPRTDAETPLNKEEGPYSTTISFIIFKI